MQTEEFDYLIRRAAQSLIPSSEAEIEVGWQQLLAASGGLGSWLSGELRQQPSCIDLLGPHGRLAASAPPASLGINSWEGLPAQ